MAIRVITPNPAGLLTTIINAFASVSTAPPTWRRDTHGDFTHTPEQWNSQGWFEPISPNAGATELVFKFKTYSFKTKKNNNIYPFYHGRFVELLIAHFKTGITNIIVTPTATAIDSLAPDKPTDT